MPYANQLGSWQSGVAASRKTGDARLGLCLSNDLLGLLTIEPGAIGFVQSLVGTQNDRIRIAFVADEGITHVACHLAEWDGSD